MKNKETKILVVIGAVVIALGALIAMVYKSSSGQAADEESGANDRCVSNFAGCSLQCRFEFQD